MTISGTSNATSAGLEFRVLGPLEVLAADGPIAIAGGRQRAILALLVLELGRTVGSERLIDEVWGSDPPPTVRQALRVHVAGLRHALGAGHIQTQPNGYRLRSERARADVRGFEELVADATRALEGGDPETAAAGFATALALWRGPALADLAGQHAARAARARLDELRAVVIERWVDAELASGRHLAQVPELRRLVADAPLREAFQSRLMLALYRSGRQADALAVYQAAREVLDRELGVEPGPELEAAQRAVLRHDPDLAAPAVTRRPHGRTEHPGGDPASLAGSGSPTQGAPKPPRVASEYAGPNPGRPAAPMHPTRRTVTALAAQVSGPRTGEALDPESTSRPPSSLYEGLRAIARRHGGTLQPSGSDVLQAVFGMPELHEDDALRAVRAAVEMREAVAGFNDGVETSSAVRLELRVGLATAEVLAHGSEGSDVVVTGAAASEASGLAQAARPGEILLAEPTYRLVRQVADTDLSRPIGLGGRAPVRVRRVVSAPAAISGHQLRLDSPLVGRQRELRQLELALEQVAEDRACHLFTLLGPAGVGKSRLVHEFLGSVRGDALVVRGRCRPYGEQVSFGPLAEAVREAGEIGIDDDAPTARARMEALLAGHPRAAIVAERVAGAIGLGAETSSSEETFWAVRTLFERAASSRPLAVVFDDVQWGEPGFLDLVEHLAEAIRDVPILLLCIGRPELLEERPGWGGGAPRSASAMLRPLADRDVSQLITNLLGGLPASPALAARIAEATEGSPLFVEEFLAELVETGAVRRRGDEYILTGDPASVRTPASIMAVLAARLDHLPSDERLVIQRAAVIGKIFTGAAVAAISEALRPEELERCLAALSRRELTRSDSAMPQHTDSYRFKHILLRDAAYGGLPKRDRIIAHERLAAWLAGETAASTGLDDELIGAHLEQSFAYRTELGQSDHQTSDIGRRAATHLGTAGTSAFGRGQNRTAVSLLARAAALLPPDDPDRLWLLVELGEAHAEGGDVTAFREVNDELLSRAERLGLESVRWHARLARTYVSRFFAGGQNNVEARADVRAAIDYFMTIGDNRALGRAWWLAGELESDTGELERTRPTFEQALRYSILAGDIRYEARARTRVAVIDLFGPAPVAQAMQTYVEFLAWARSSGQLVAELTALAGLGRLKAMVGEFDEARRMVKAAAEMSGDLQGPLHAAYAIVGWIQIVEWLAWEPVAGERALRAGLEALERLGATGQTRVLHAALARTLYLQGRVFEADVETRTWPVKSDDPDRYDQQTWRGIRALVLAKLGDTAAAVALAREALALADAGEMVLFRGQAREELAEVLEQLGQEDEAAALVAEAIDLYERKGITVFVDRLRQRQHDADQLRNGLRRTVGLPTTPGADGAMAPSTTRRS